VTEAALPSPETPRFSNGALAAVWQLNDHFLHVLAERARESSWPDSPWSAVLGQDLSTRLGFFHTDLAQTPVCLVDLGLQACEPGERPWAPIDRQVLGPDLFRPDQTFELARLSLTLAWTFSRLDPASTTIIFGLSKGWITRIGRLEVHGVPQLCRGLQVRPRWSDKPRIWSRLLDEPPPVVASRLPPTHIRMLQRQFADLSRATSVSR
jgi:hypothetical protein